MQGITKMIDEFDYEKVTNCYYGKCHDALIGEWINWWLVNTKKSNERRIINPAIRASYYGNYFADVLFFERNNESKSYKAIGVAEIENNLSKYLSKLKSLNAYIFAKEINSNKKFPDLKFVLLSTILKTDEEGNATDLHYDAYEELKHKIKHYSKKSKDIYWIYYQMKLKKYADPDEKFDVDDRFWYSHSFADKPDYFIAKNGKTIKEVIQ